MIPERANRGIDGLMAHMGGWIIRLHETQSLRNLLRRPVQMYELAREPGETADAFTARASAGPSGAVYLPDNGCDALATGMGER